MIFQGEIARGYTCFITRAGRWVAGRCMHGQATWVKKPMLGMVINRLRIPIMGWMTINKKNVLTLAQMVIRGWSHYHS